MTAAGIVVGVAGAAALSRSLEGLVFGVEPMDPLTFGCGRRDAARRVARGVLRPGLARDADRADHRAARGVSRDQGSGIRDREREAGSGKRKPACVSVPRMLRRPAFWIALALLSAGATLVGVRYFPQAFSIVALDITMDRGRALDEARAVASRNSLGPPGYRQAASFSGDNEAQTFVELEGGGKAAFTRMLREHFYEAYTWRVRHFKEGETNESTIRFTPDGRPYGFVELLREDAPGPALDAAAARRIAEEGAASRWSVDLSRFSLAESGQERRPSGRVDHTFTYERADETLKEGRYRLRLVVSGDRLTEVTHFIRIPEAFTRRYASMRSANDIIGIGSTVGLVLLYVIGGIGVGMFFMMRSATCCGEPRRCGASRSADSRRSRR